MDPLALLPYALAAAGGRHGPYEVTALVAAGGTLLQRSAPLVRALSGRRSAVLLPPGPVWLVALAASDGRGTVVLDASTAMHAEALRAHDVGAVFTVEALAEQLPADMVHVLLDQAPFTATVVAGGRTTTVDLGSHFGLDLVGDSSGPGSAEECVLLARSGARYTHAEVIDAARIAMEQYQFTPVDRTVAVVAIHDLASLTNGLVAPLLAGGILRHLHTEEPANLLEAIGTMDATIVVAGPAHSEWLRSRAAADDRLARLKRVIELA